MPGTVLDPKEGTPQPLPIGILGNTFSLTFPNRMIQRALSVQIVDIFKNEPSPTMESIRRLIEATIADQDALKSIESQTGSFRTYHMRPLSKICIRKMMGRYWENFSPFALDLAGAVMRQGIFVEKMCKIDWIHSPSAQQTMSRLIQKYTRFFSIMAAHPFKVAVPTLDVDLAWHTHQLSPYAYYIYSMRQTNKFIDHDDKMDEGKLGEAFEWTSKTYQIRYAEIYSECTCEYCSPT
jgi:hypothetical protein